MSSSTHLLFGPSEGAHGLPIRQDGRLTSVGQIHPNAATIQISKNLLGEIIDFSELDFERETGGFLLGEVTPGGTPQVRIRHFLPATEARSQSARLTFTHESWSAMNRQAQQHFRDDVVVGWQHTHPNMGIFLSAYDLFIHRHFFREPWHIALVVDPVRQELGFFQWRENEVVDCGCVIED
jgi:proteasome lid subunit RPN8/RPN11